MNDDPIAFNHVLFYGRGYEEVLEMIALTEEDLKGKKILDCPSGPDAFVAGAARRGFDITGCDPIYAGTLAEVTAQGHTDISLALEVTRQRPQQLNGVDADAFTAKKFRALEEFSVDYEAGRAAGRYLPAALPNLPFADKSFDLVISANLLCTYSSIETGGIAGSNSLDLDFHRAAVHELIRVCRGELRLYPVMTHRTNRLHSYVAQIIGQLAADGVTMQFVESNNEQANFTGHLVLVIDCG